MRPFYSFVSFGLILTAGLSPAQLQNGQEPDFQLSDVNPDSARNASQPAPPPFSPRQYRQQISAYYFSQEWCHICQEQFTQLQELSNNLKGTTDLPVVISGIHLLGASQNTSMFTGKKLSWMRETATFRPWQNWRVPISSRPGQEIRWRDIVILDENNKFIAVQNLTDNPITDPANYTRLRNTLIAASSIADSDVDGIPDRWELDQTAGPSTPGSLIPIGTQIPTPSGVAGLLAYAFSMPLTENGSAFLPSVSLARVEGQDHLQLQYRRRLGLEGERLGYLPECSGNGESWSHAPADWIQTGVTTPFDGSGTEIITVRRTSPVAPGREMVRLRVNGS